MADSGAESAVSTAELGARIGALASRMTQATYQLLVMLAEFDARDGWAGVGIKSCAHWLSWTCSLSPGAAREHVRVARALPTLPLVSAEMAAGRLSYAKVREITRMTDADTDEAALVELARTATASQLARSVRAYRRAAGDRLRQERLRTVTWRTADDGSVVMSAQLPAEEGAAVIAALEAARDDLRRQAIESDSPVPVDVADMLLHVARGFLAATPEDRSGEDRTMVVVHVDAAHLTGSARSRGNVSAPAAIAPGTCQVAGVGGIEPDTARRLACDALLVGIIRGAGGVVLAHGRRRRLVSPAQRRALQARDGGCRFPGCQRVSHLEAHHVTPWSHGGATDLDNLILLCRFHHLACHEGGIRILTPPTAAPGSQTWEFRTADGDPLIRPGATPVATGARERWLTAPPTRDESIRLLPLWAGEPFSLADTVAVLFDIAAGGTRTDDQDQAA